MYGSAAQQIINQQHENLRHEDHDERLYVVRDLSWELARFLEAEDSLASTFATPDGSNGNPPHHE